MGQAAAASAAEGDYRVVRNRAVADRRLFVRYRRDGDLVARRELFERFMPLAHRLAHRYWWRRDQIDDLVQVASVGLVKAIDRFDHERGVAFSSYAVPTIVGELKRHLRDTGWALHVPQRMQARVLEVGQATDALRIKLGRSPTTEEVAKQLGLTAACVAEAAEAASAFDTVSLDRARDDDEPAAGDGIVLAFEDDRFDLVEYGAMIGPTLQALPARERLIIRMRFEGDMTQSEIAGRLGMSQMHVSRLLRRALGRLRAVAHAHSMV
jgi:RNA polymerase sigma-B factor